MSSSAGKEQGLGLILALISQLPLHSYLTLDMLFDFCLHFMILKWG